MYKYSIPGTSSIADCAGAPVTAATSVLTTPVGWQELWDHTLVTKMVDGSIPDRSRETYQHQQIWHNNLPHSLSKKLIYKNRPCKLRLIHDRLVSLDNGIAMSCPGNCYTQLDDGAELVDHDYPSEYGMTWYFCPLHRVYHAFFLDSPLCSRHAVNVLCSSSTGPRQHSRSTKRMLSLA